MGTVYFIQDGTGLVKIGYTKASHSTKRHLALQTGNGHDLTLLREIDGTKATEEWLHERFAAVLVPGRREWFRFHADMLTIEPPESLWKPRQKIKGATIPADAKKLGFDPCTDSWFYGRIDVAGRLTLWGKSKRTGHTWTALGAFSVVPFITAL